MAGGAEPGNEGDQGTVKVRGGFRDLSLAWRVSDSGGRQPGGPSVRLDNRSTGVPTPRRSDR